MKRSNGFTLLETVIFIVVLAVGLTGIVGLFVQTTHSSADPYVRERAVAIANAYMDEIMAMRFDENTPVGGGCVESGSGSCTAYCATLSDTLCVHSKCRLQAAGSCLPRANVSGIATEEGARSAYDDVDDYADLVEVPTGLEGSAGEYADFLVQVRVSQPATAWQGIDPRDLRLIRVEVSALTDETIGLDAYRVNF